MHALTQVQVRELYCMTQFVVWKQAKPLLAVS